MRLSFGAMRPSLAALVVVAAGLAAGLAAPASAEMRWSGEALPAALERAGREHKLVLVDLGARWCAPCRAMDRELWPRPEVGERIARDFVPLKRDGEEGEGRTIAERYHVVGFPTVLLLAPDGAEVDRVMGGYGGADGARELLGLLGDLRAGRGTTAELERRAKRGVHDPALANELARRHALRGDARADAELEQVVAGDLDDRGGRASQALLTLGKYVALRGRKDNALAARALERLCADYPRSPAAAEAPFHLAAAYHGLGDDTKALATLDRWLAAAPDPDQAVERADGYGWCSLRYGFASDRATAVLRGAIARGAKGAGAARLWDTLAELEAQAGRLAEARSAESHAAAAAPTDPYYPAQLARFGGGHG